MAIKVGVTSLRVIMATVVLLLARLRGRLLGRILVLKRLGRMTGVKVLLGRVKVSLDLELIPREDGLTVELREGVVTVRARDDLVFSSSMFSTELEAKVKSR